MITDERLTAFINSLDTGNPAYLNELEKEARETNVPIIRTETQSLLRTLISINSLHGFWRWGRLLVFLPFA